MTAAQWGAPLITSADSVINAHNNLSTLEKKRHLRAAMRRARRSLSHREHLHAGHRLKQQLNQNPYFKYAKHIAIYLPNDGEVSTQAAIQQAWDHKQTVYLPVLHPLKDGHLWFVEYTPYSAMKKNRFGIMEPDPKLNRRIQPRFIQTIGLPLVAFDKQGNRLGMGGGFYDRTFEFCRIKKGIKPKLFGLAHRCQAVEILPTESWDIQLSSIIIC